MRFITVKRSALLFALAAVVAFIAGVVAVAVTGSAAVYNNKTVRKLPIYSVETPEKVVALSFDACWGADSTQGILDTLESYDVSANFFVVSIWANKYPELLKKLSDSGRVEIGTHSNTHPNMSQLSKSEMALELSTSVEIIESITEKKVELFRPPFGDYSDAVITAAENANLYTIQWDVDSLDWKGLTSAQIAQRVLSKCRNGSIVLMHNDGARTLEALPAIIEGLRLKGYSFKTIGDLIYRDNYEIDHTGRQVSKAGQ